MGYDIKYHHVKKTLGQDTTEMRRHGREGTKLRESADLCTTNVRRRHFHRKRIYRVGGDKGRGKTWTKAKTFFGALYKACRSYESDMKAHRSSFEMANRLTQSPRHGSEQSMADRSTGTAATRETTKCPTNQWVEYSDSLEDSLLESK